MIVAQNSQDLYFMAQALGIASQGQVKFMSTEHAKALWMAYIRESGFDIPKKPKPFIPVAGMTQDGEVK